MTDAADGATALVEAVDRRDLPRFEATWRDLAAPAGRRRGRSTTPANSGNEAKLYSRPEELR